MYLYSAVASEALLDIITLEVNLYQVVVFASRDLVRDVSRFKNGMACCYCHVFASCVCAFVLWFDL